MTEGIISCPKCGSMDLQPTGSPDAHGDTEYRCNQCGHYFVDAAEVEEIYPDDL